MTRGVAEKDRRRHPPTPQERFGEEVGRKAERKLRAKQEKERAAWFWLGMFGLVGWSVALPTLIGVALGMWLDRSWPGSPSWTLNLLIVGVIVGCLNAWYWVRREGQRR